LADPKKRLTLPLVSDMIFKSPRKRCDPKLSNHSKGLAIDINPLYNPYVKTNKNGKIIISPEKGKKYADRKQSFPYKIDKNDLCYKEFIKHGFIWGGAWKSLKDYQHFEKVRQ